jgi:hypothetical protein
MKTKSIVLVSATLLTTVVAGVAARHAAADNRAIAPINTAPVGVKPAPVTPKIPVDLGQKKSALFNKALGGSGLPPLQLAPPPAFIRLTPAAPSGAGGAKISKVGRSVYFAADPQAPDGAFLVDAAPPNLPALGSVFSGFTNLPHFPDSSGQVEMSFTTEGTKQYIADCRFTPMDGFDLPRVLTFQRSSSTTPHSLTQDDGHYLYAFRAEQGGTMQLTVTVPNAAGPHYFFGCEISKLN